jgi:hypothetical protein
MSSKKKPETPTTQALLERNVVRAAKRWARIGDPTVNLSESVEWCEQLEHAVKLLLYHEAGGCGKPGCRMGSGGLVNKSYCRECREMFTMLDTLRAEIEEKP